MVFFSHCDIQQEKQEKNINYWEKCQKADFPSSLNSISIVLNQYKIKMKIK